MNAAKILFETEANKFDNIIPKLIPFYNEIYDILIDSIPFDREEPLKILDIGCGTGTFAQILKERFPNSKITCLDFAKNMIAEAKIKLFNYRNDIYFLVGDFNNLNIENEYDVIVSSFALHHIQTDAEKMLIYKNIYSALKKSGVFLTADIVLGVNNYINTLYENKWKKHMARKFPNQQLETNVLTKYQADDNPSKLFDHLKWLETAGFGQVENIWKYYNFAIYGGFKFINS